MRQHQLTWMLCAPAALALAAGLHSAQIDRISPLGVLPGQRTAVTFHGSGLEEATNLWSDFGAKARRVVEASDKAVTLEIECPVDGSGVGVARLYGTGGATKPVLMLLDPLPAVREIKVIKAGQAIDARFVSPTFEKYELELAAGESISLEVLAHRIGSNGDPVLRILDADGREAAWCDDEDGVWRDARLVFTAPKAGKYAVLVHDSGYGGGHSFFYRLRAGAFPIRSYGFPLGALQNCGGARHGSPANPPELSLSEGAAMMLEKEPNDSADRAHRTTVPMVLHGRFQSGTDRDFYRFEAAQGQVIRFEARTRSLGSPCDAALRLLDAEGNQRAESAGATPDDGAVIYGFEKAGAYFLEVRELSGAAPAGAPYRIDVTEGAAAGFSLAAEQDLIQSAPGETVKIKIDATRQSYKGAITLELAEPAGLKFDATEIPANKNSGEISLTIETNTAAGQLLAFRLIGTGTNEARVSVSTKPALRKTFPLMLHPPPGLDGLFAIGVRKK